MSASITSWPLLVILSLLLSSACCLHMARDAYRRPTSDIADDTASATDAVSDEATAKEDNDDDDEMMIVEPSVLMLDKLAASDNGHRFDTVALMRSRTNFPNFNQYMGQSYLFDERPLNYRRPPRPIADENYRPDIQRYPHHHYYPDSDDVPAGIARNSPNHQRPMPGATARTTKNLQRHSETPLSLQALFTGSASSGGQPEPPPSHLDIRLEQSQQLKRAHSTKTAAVKAAANTKASSASFGTLPLTNDNREPVLPASSKRAPFNSGGGNSGAQYRSINGESVLQGVAGGGANFGDSGGGGIGGGGGGGVKGSSFVGMMPQQFTHGIASQFMMRSSRGQRNYDVPQIGELTQSIMFTFKLMMLFTLFINYRS